jgi:hypothetical protein
MLIALLIAGALAGEPASGDPAEVPPAVAQGRYEQLRGEMERMAGRNAWGGVEDAWTEIQGLGITIPVPTRLLAADSARIRGDAWSAYQRLADVLRVDPEAHGVAGQMQIYRENYGRVTVRRVEATPIPLEAAEVPLMPEARAALDFAAKQLKTTGGFDGMLPVGNYTVGTYPIEVKATLEPVVVQRVLGD